MKKIKAKLHYFLVIKNPNIKNEYESLKKASVWNIIKLNWHYRILKRTSPLYKNNAKRINAPFTGGSESEAFSRIPAEEFVKKLSSFDVISFDIFDTLLLRPLRSPADLFTIIGKRLKIDNFKEFRTAAEAEARIESLKKNKHSEINIYDIYKKLAQKIDIDIDNCVQEELLAERQFCFSNPYMKKVFDRLKEMGKTIIITSDMYIPNVEMKKLLECCDYTGYHKLYVSCDLGINKSQGGLYSFIKKEHADARIIHVGDNYSSDINSASKAKIASVYYKNCHEIGNPYRKEDIIEPIGSLYSGIVNTHLHSGEKTYSEDYEYGFIYLGLNAVLSKEKSNIKAETKQGIDDFVNKYLHFSKNDNYLRNISPNDAYAVYNFKA